MTEYAPQRRPEVTTNVGTLIYGLFKSGKKIWHCPICKKAASIGDDCCGWNQQGYQVKNDK